MYLRLLPSEQKPLFLDLCLHAMHSDGTIADEEKEAITIYCGEMDISTRYDLQCDSLSIALSELASLSSANEKRIIYFEILALMFADSDFSSQEKAFVDAIAQAFSISPTEQEKLQVTLEELLLANAKADAIILADNQ